MSSRQQQPGPKTHFGRPGWTCFAQRYPCVNTRYSRNRWNGLVCLNGFSRDASMLWMERNGDSSLEPVDEAIAEPLQTDQSTAAVALAGSFKGARAKRKSCTASGLRGGSCGGNRRGSHLCARCHGIWCRRHWLRRTEFLYLEDTQLPS